MRKGARRDGCGSAFLDRAWMRKVPNEAIGGCELRAPVVGVRLMGRLEAILPIAQRGEDLYRVAQRLARVA